MKAFNRLLRCLLFLGLFADRAGRNWSRLIVSRCLVYSWGSGGIIGLAIILAVNISYALRTVDEEASRIIRPGL